MDEFGWLLSGPTSHSPWETNVALNLIISGETSNERNETDEIKNMLKTLWETEGIGIVDHTYSNLLLSTIQLFNYSYHQHFGMPPFNSQCGEEGEAILTTYDLPSRNEAIHLNKQGWTSDN